MTEVQANIDQLFDSRFVTGLLALRSDEGYIAGHATGFYVEDADLESLRPLLTPTPHYPGVGQIGCYRGNPVCPKANAKTNGQPTAEYKGILFTFWVYREVLPASSFREWLAERREDESKKKPAYDALAAYEALATRNTITKEELSPVLQAARSRYFVSRDIGMRFLSRLAAKHSVVREAMADLIRIGKAAEKVHVLGSLSDYLPKSFCIDLIRQGLKDRSKLVRRAAADVSRCLVLSEMVDDLCQAARVERDVGTSWPDTKWQIEHAVALIRDGFDLYKRPDGSEAFVVRISDGFPATLLCPGPGWCTEADIKQMGAKAVAEELRRTNSDATQRPFKWPKE